MSVDPKIRSGMPVRSSPTTGTGEAKPTTPPGGRPATPGSVGFEGASTFQNRRADADSLGRGAADDGVGRGRGAADDGVGRGRGAADDGVGRGRGAADDGVGRTRRNGAADDGVGDSRVREALVGRETSEDAVALRNALFGRLETPSFLKAGDVGPQVLSFARARLSASEIDSLKVILGQISEAGATLLGALLEKAPEALKNADSEGNTLLANLESLSHDALNPLVAAETSKDELVTSVLRELVNPNRIDQGDAPTCTATSMQFELVTDEPSEYVRLMAGLCGPRGRVPMRGGEELATQAGDGAALDGRSVSEALFQTAAMEFGNGRSLDFDPRARRSTNAAGAVKQRGLRPEQQSRLLKQLFGVKYETKRFANEGEGAKALEQLRSYDSRSAQNRPILLQIDQGPFNHAVTFERVANQRVFFRDPYGELRSMPEGQFKISVVGMNVPDGLQLA